MLIQDDQAPNTEEQVRAAQLLQSKYGRAAVNAYVQGWLGDADIRCSEELSLEEDKDYIMSLLAILGSKDASAGYVVQELDGIFAKWLFDPANADPEEGEEAVNFDFVTNATAKELEQFKSVCNQLLSRTYIVRTIYQPGKAGWITQTIFSITAL